MKLIHPISTRTDDRSIPAARNPVCGEPYDWFDTDYFRGRSLSCISFNFLVDWREHALQRVAWLKRVITEEFTTDADEIAGAILRCDTGSYVDAARLFCDRNAFALQYVLIPDIPVEAWADPANKVIVFDMTKYAAKDFAHCVQTYSAMEFVALIRSYKKDYHPIGHGKDKSGTQYRLQYSETNLEVFLSEENAQLQYEGDTGFPGDADVVLFDAEGAAKAVIELKKHAEGSRAGAARIEDESLALYLRTSPANADGQNRQPKRNDVLKYDSLNLLAAEFGCPFHQLFFPVTQERTVKVESFVPSGRNLYRYSVWVHPLPVCGQADTMRDFADAFYAQNAQGSSLIGTFQPASDADIICTAPSITPYHCPQCGAPVRLGKKGYYCFDFCGMSLRKVSGCELTQEQCAQLLEGNPVPSVFIPKFQNCVTVLPSVKSWRTPDGEMRYFWNTRRQNAPNNR